VLIDDNNTMSCSCPDHDQRGSLCKHILFVLIRALGVNSDTVFREFFQTNRFIVGPDILGTCANYLERRAQGLVNANFAPDPIAPVAEPPVSPAQLSRADRLRELYGERLASRTTTATTRPPAKVVVEVKKVPRKEYLEDMCPICCEDFKDTTVEPTVWCQLSCGNSVHQSCFQKWTQAQNSRLAKQATCVHCRSKWLCE
jgi:hypothetical protein